MKFILFLTLSIIPITSFSFVSIYNNKIIFQEDLLPIQKFILEESVSNYSFLSNLNFDNFTMDIDFKSANQTNLNEFISYIYTEHSKYERLIDSYISDELREEYQDYLFSYDGAYYFYNMPEHIFKEIIDKQFLNYDFDLYAKNNFYVSPMGVNLQDSQKKFSFELDLSKNYCYLKSDNSIRIPKNRRLETRSIDARTKQVGTNISHLNYQNIILTCKEDIQPSFMDNELSYKFSFYPL